MSRQPRKHGTVLPTHRHYSTINGFFITFRQIRSSSVNPGKKVSRIGIVSSYMSYSFLRNRHPHPFRFHNGDHSLADLSFQSTAFNLVETLELNVGRDDMCHFVEIYDGEIVFVRAELLFYSS